MTIDEARKVLLQQSDVVEGEHHGHPDFRVNKKIFATLWPDQKRSVLRLPIEFAEGQAMENAERAKLVSTSGGMGWLSVDLPKWKIKDFRPIAELARSLLK